MESVVTIVLGLHLVVMYRENRILYKYGVALRINLSNA
jgi:hypothetical protein